MDSRLLLTYHWQGKTQLVDFIGNTSCKYPHTSCKTLYVTRICTSRNGPCIIIISTHSTSRCGCNCNCSIIGTFCRRINRSRWIRVYCYRTTGRGRSATGRFIGNNDTVSTRYTSCKTLYVTWICPSRNGPCIIIISTRSTSRCGCNCNCSIIGTFCRRINRSRWIRVYCYRTTGRGRSATGRFIGNNDTVSTRYTSCKTLYVTWICTSRNGPCIIIISTRSTSRCGCNCNCSIIGTFCRRINRSRWIRVYCYLPLAEAEAQLVVLLVITTL